MKRGEVWWAHVDLAIDDDFSVEDKRRPVVLLSDDAPEVRTMLVVTPATKDIRGICVEVRVSASEGLLREGALRVALPRPGRILGDWLGTLGRDDLIERAGALSPSKLRDLEDALRLAKLDPARWA